MPHPATLALGAAEGQARSPSGVTSAYFSRKNADAAQEKLRAAGYCIDRVKRGLRRTLVEFSRHDAADLATANAFTQEIVGIASRHGGAYDGWAGFLVTQPPRTSHHD